MTDEQDKFLRDIKQQLDESAEGLDGATLSRLRQARSRALEPRPRRLWLPVGATALASVTALAVGLWLHAPASTGPEPALEDLEMLAAAEDPAVYEDLDFYYWLEAQDDQS